MTMYKFTVMDESGRVTNIWVNSDKDLQSTINTLEQTLHCQVQDYEIFGEVLNFVNFYKNNYSITVSDY